MIKGVHTMFFSSEPEALREFLRDKLGFDSFNDVGGGWLIFDLPEADMGVHPADPAGTRGQPAGTHERRAGRRDHLRHELRAKAAVRELDQLAEQQVAAPAGVE